jgi:Rrf2 family protein
MFTVSTKGDYGMLFMIELVKQYQKGWVSLSDFAKQKHISSNYLHQIVTPLKKKGLIISKEGVNGGYHLRKSPNKISMLSVLEALEGPVGIVRCMTYKQHRNCPVIKKCDGVFLWHTMQRELISIFKKKTLQDIVFHTPKNFSFYMKKS